MFANNNLNQFLNRFDENKRAKMRSVYIASFQNHRETCKEAVKTRDASALLSSVHDVKSLCFMLEANEEGALAETIEEALKSGDNNGAFNRMQTLFQNIDHILEVMSSHS